MPEINSQLVGKLASAVANLEAVVRAIKGETVEIPQENAEMRDRLYAAGICLRCLQKKAGRYTRGDCISCYNQTINEINTNKTTWEDVIKKGRILPEPKKGGRKPDKNRPGADELTDISLAAINLLPPLIPENIQDAVDQTARDAKESKKTKAKK